MEEIHLKDQTAAFLNDKHNNSRGRNSQELLKYSGGSTK